jgi:hypothetical protein
MGTGRHVPAGVFGRGMTSLPLLARRLRRYEAGEAVVIRPAAPGRNSVRASL